MISLLHSALFVTIALTLRGSTLTFGQNPFLSLVASVTASEDLTE